MKLTQLGTGSDGSKSYEIRSNELSYRALLRSIRRIPGVIVTEASHDLMNDDTLVTIKYKNMVINIDTPFSDYIIKCTSPNEYFDEFISELHRYKVRWWEHFF